MITITQGFRSRTFPNEQLPAICLQLNGGGYTPKQTANAMALQAEIKAHGNATLKRASGDIKIELKED